MQFTRRRFLQSAISGSAACGLARVAIAKEDSASDAIIDTHVYLGHWPHRQLSNAEPGQLAAALRRNHVRQAWVGSFDGLFHKDIAGVNHRLAEACAKVAGKLLIPLGGVNPTLPGWEDDIRRCHETFHMPGIRLHPNYHGYNLDDPRFGRLLKLSAERNLVVQLVAGVNSDRHLLLTPPAMQVDLKPLAEQLTRLPRMRLLVANGYSGADDESTRALLPLKQVYFDLGRAAAAVAVRQLIEKTSADRVVFGSGAPLRDLESVAAKRGKSMTAEVQRMLAGKNAERLIAHN